MGISVRAGVLMGLIAVACDGSSGEDQGTSVIRALCEFAVRCELDTDVASCLADQDEAARVDASVAAGRIRVDSKLATSCVAYLRRAACTSAIGNAIDEQCGQVFTGTVPTGGACFSEIDCAGRAPCFNPGDVNLACMPGECGSPQPPPSTSGPCDGDGDCAPGFYCPSSFDPSSPKTCSPKVGAGEPCGGPGACPADSACAQVNGTGPTRCLPLAPDGASCRDVPCAGMHSACLGADRVCQPLRPLGQPCTDVPCRDHLRCVSGTCQLRPALGEACTPVTTGPDLCRRGKCTGGTCQEPTCPAAQGS